MLSGDHVVFIDQVARPQRLQTVSAVGVSFPLHSTANGKALLATLDEAEVRKLLPARLRRLTCHTITSLDVLLAELEEVRETGLAWDREENDIGICAVGSTVATGVGIVTAVSIPVPASRFAGREDELATVAARRLPAHGAQAGGMSGPAAALAVARRGLPGSEGVSRDRARRDVVCLLRRTTSGRRVRLGPVAREGPLEEAGQRGLVDRRRVDGDLGRGPVRGLRQVLLAQAEVGQRGRHVAGHGEVPQRTRRVAAGDAERVGQAGHLVGQRRPG